jgi:hypothetical protein
MRPRRLRPGQKLKAGHSRHVDVGQDLNKRLVTRIADALKCHGRGLRKFHCEPAGAEVAPELLAEQNLRIGLIVDHKNEHVHARSPDMALVVVPRGRTILNSVNSPSSVSTSIDPP